MGDEGFGIGNLLGDLSKTRKIMQDTTLMQICVNLTGIAVANNKKPAEVVRKFFEIMKELKKQGSK